MVLRERITTIMENERQLLRSARKLDEKALIAIFDYYALKVYVRALNMGQDTEKADDIVREVFARFLDEVAKGKGPRNDLMTYLYQAADRLITTP
jgi:DNA-directed RNA polymerase specialized sigma24 family protein